MSSLKFSIELPFGESCAGLPEGCRFAVLSARLHYSVSVTARTSSFEECRCYPCRTAARLPWITARTSRRRTVVSQLARAGRARERHASQQHSTARSTMDFQFQRGRKKPRTENRRRCVAPSLRAPSAASDDVSATPPFLRCTTFLQVAVPHAAQAPRRCRGRGSRRGIG